MTESSAERADLDLQIHLPAEHELTKHADLIGAMAERLGVRTAASAELPEIKKDVAPEAVLDPIEGTQGDRGTG